MERVYGRFWKYHYFRIGASVTAPSAHWNQHESTTTEPGNERRQLKKKYAPAFPAEAGKEIGFFVEVLTRPPFPIITHGDIH